MALTAELREWVEKEHSLRPGMVGSSAREEWARDIRAEYVLKLVSSQEKVREPIAGLEVEKLRLVEQQTRQGSGNGLQSLIHRQDEEIAKIEAKSAEIDALIAEAQGRIEAKWWIDNRDELKTRMNRYPRALPTKRLAALRKPPLSIVETIA